MAKTGLSFLPDDAFHYLELSTLYLNGNNFKQVPEALAALGSTLRYLNINQNPIEELNDNSFLGLRNLREIVASGLTELQAVKAGTFSRLEDLKIVSCSYNPKLVFVDRLAFWDQSNNKRFSLKEVNIFKKCNLFSVFNEIIRVNTVNRNNNDSFNVYLNISI